MVNATSRSESESRGGGPSRSAAKLGAVAAMVLIGGALHGQLLEPGEAKAPAVKGTGVRNVVRPLSEENRKQIAELDSPTLRAREQATVSLKTSPLLTLAQVERVLAEETLSAEQFSRLSGIAKEQFLRSPRAALGVQFDDFGARSSEGVPITRTIEGFDSCRVLKAGDVMYAMSGVRVTSLDDARKVITSHDPGERMTIHLFRNGEALIVRAALGDYADLESRPGRGGGGVGFAGNRGGRGYDVMDAAWALRLARVMGEKLNKGEMIDPGVGVGEYAAMEAEIDRAVESQEKREHVKTVARRDVGGEGAEPEHVIVAGGGAGGQVGLEAAADFAGPGRVAGSDEATLQVQRNQLQLELNNINMMLMQQQLDPKKRQAMTQQSMRVRMLLMEIDAKLAQQKLNRQGQGPKP